MAIRMEHPAWGIGGLAAYASGRGRAKERTRKYGVDMYLQQNYLRARQAELARQQQAAFQADQQQHAWNVEAAQQQNLWRTQAADREHAWDLERTKTLDEKRMREERFSSLPPIPKDLEDPSMRRDLEGKRAAIRDMLTTGRWDLTRPEVQAELEGLIGSYQTSISSWKPPSAAETWNRGLSWEDPKTGRRSDTPVEGWTPMQGDKPAPSVVAGAAAEVKRAETEKKSAEEAAKMQEKIRKEATDHMKSADFQEKYGKLPYAEQFQKAMEAVKPTFPAAGAATTGSDGIEEIVVDESGAATFTTPEKPAGPPAPAAPVAEPPAPETIPITIMPDTAPKTIPIAIIPDTSSSIADSTWRKAKELAVAEERAPREEQAQRRADAQLRRQEILRQRQEAVQRNAMYKSMARKYRLGRF